MRSTEPPSPRPSFVLFAIVALALAVGAAASLIAGVAAAPTFHPGGASEVVVSAGIIDAAILLLFGFVLGMFLWIRFRPGAERIEGRLAVVGLTMLLTGVLFLAFLEVLGSGRGGYGFPGGGGSPPGGSGNGTGNPGANLTGPGGQLTFFSVHLPSWAPFAIVAAVLLVAGAVAIPRALGAARKRDHITGRPKPAEVAEVREAFAVAARRLEQGREPREVIIALYATVLRRVGPLVGGVDADTPEEIRALHLVRLGIRSSAAETLTRLFEEARYSSHPMGSDAAARAALALREARDDLDRPLRAS